MARHARVGLAMVGLVAACQGKADPTPAPKPAPPAPDLTPIVAHAGPLELVADDGDEEKMTIGEYRRKLADYPAKHPEDHFVVIAAHFPPGLPASAWAGQQLVAHDHNVSWVIADDAQHGYALIYDENANGDLRDDARHPFVAHGDSLDVTITSSMTDGESKTQLPIAQRMRIKAGKLFSQAQLVRRGTITVGERARPFVLVANGGDFHFPTSQLVLDLDGDGVAGPLVDAEHESPEALYGFEHTVNVGGRSYDFATDLRGDALTLTPRATPVPARPSLAVGSPAPELAGADLDGQPVALSGLRGKTVLVDFWAPWCGPCRDALPRLADLYRRRHGEGLDILSIIDGERADVVKLLGAAPYPGHEVLDSQDIALAYRVFNYPSYFIIDPAGKIACARCQLDDVMAKLDRAPSGS